jgi:formylglycine-generating enzyme required for sulfatase activity
MDQFEVTNALYAKCVEAQVCDIPSRTSSYKRTSYYGNNEYANFPVIFVSWDNAKTYCEWRNARLPTEAEWEKAARGGLEDMSYPWGDEVPVCELKAVNGARFDDNLVCVDSDTEEVGSYNTNGYELYDMVGNVWEWTNDWYDGSYYGTSLGITENPTGPNSGVYRVSRGGAWVNDNFGLRVAYRGYFPPDTGSNSIGFRCARSP